MKKFFCFLLSVIVTMSVMTIFFNVVNKWKNNINNYDYELNTCISVECKGIRIANCYGLSYEEYANEEGNLEFTINVEKYDQRAERFEISVFNNYLQTNFSMKKNNKISSYVFEINENQQKKSVNIIIPKDTLAYNNNFIINVRQDINVYSADNECVRNSNTVCLNFGIIKKDDKRREIQYNVMEVSDEKEVTKKILTKIFTLKCLNREENVLLNVKPNEEIKMCLSVGENGDCEDTMIWCCLNSQQVKINNKLCILTRVKRGYSGKVNICFKAPEEKGLYEFELFGQSFEDNSITSAERYTIKVE